MLRGRPILNRATSTSNIISTSHGQRKQPQAYRTMPVTFLNPASAAQPGYTVYRGTSGEGGASWVSTEKETPYREELGRLSMEPPIRSCSSKHLTNKRGWPEPQQMSILLLRWLNTLITRRSHRQHGLTSSGEELVLILVRLQKDRCANRDTAQ